jgi:hypothetical protein
VPAGPAVTETARVPGPVPLALAVATTVTIRATTTSPATARITVVRRPSDRPNGHRPNGHRGARQPRGQLLDVTAP